MSNALKEEQRKGKKITFFRNYFDSIYVSVIARQQKRKLEQKLEKRQAEMARSEDPWKMMEKVLVQRKQAKTRPLFKDAEDSLVKGCDTDKGELDQLIGRYDKMNEHDRIMEAWDFESEMEKREENLKTGTDIIALKGCRHDDGHTAEVLVATQVVLKDRDVKNPRCLRMNIIEDTYGDPILVRQAPLEEELFNWLQAIWQEMVRHLVCC